MSLESKNGNETYLLTFNLCLFVKKFPSRRLLNHDESQHSQNFQKVGENLVILSNMKPSYYSSMTSQIVFLLVVVIAWLQLIHYAKTGEIMELFNTIVSGFVGAYLQKSIGKVEE